MSELSKNEEIILLSVWKLNEEAYGVKIKGHIKTITGKDWNYGTLYCTLDQLVKKGILLKKDGKPMPERGGRRKIYYSISPLGQKTLQDAQSLHQALWADMPNLVVDRGHTK